MLTRLYWLAAVLATVEKEFSTVGLSVNKSKCVVYTRNDMPESLARAFDGLSVVRDWLVVLGSPLGSRDFTRGKVEQKLIDYANGMEMLPKLGNPHAAFKLLRDNFNRRAERLARTVPFGMCLDLFTKFDAQLCGVTCGALRRFGIAEYHARQLLRVSRKLDGRGLHDEQ
jgi:hypothetical protein